MTISTVQNYRDKIMQIFSMRYNLKFHKLTFYCLTRPQSIRKSKHISGQTILSSPLDVEFNPNYRDIPVVKNSVTRPVTQGVTDRYAFFLQFTYRQIISQLEIKFFSKHIIFIGCIIFFRYNIYCYIPRLSLN